MKSSVISLLLLAVVVWACEKCALSQESAEETQIVKLVFHDDLSNDDWRVIRNVQKPFSLDISGTSVNDEDLKKLKNLTSLVSLNLGGCQNITDKGLENISGSKSIRSLDLTNCWEITDDGMEYVSRMTALENLSLSACRQVSDAGIVELKDLPNLKCLDLMYCKLVTPAASKSISEMKKLEILIFMCWDSPEFAPADLQRLGTLPTLKKLNLNQCAEIPLDTLVRCLPLGKMEFFCLMGYKPISKQEIEKLRAAWPKCHIEIHEK